MLASTESGAVAVARERGVTRPAVGDLRLPPGNGFETVVTLGKQLGLGSSLADLRTTLTELAAVTQPGGRLVADWTRSTGQSRRLTRPTAPSPESHRSFRVEYDGLAGPWTDLLLVTPSEFRDAVSETPWTMDTLVGTETDGSMYGVQLSLPGQ